MGLFDAYFRKKQPSVSKKHKGFTLLEILLVAGVISIGIAAAMQIYGKISSENKINEQNIELSQMTTEFQKRFKKQGDFTGLTSAVAISMNVPTKSTINTTDGTILSSWNTVIAIASADQAGTGDAFSYTFSVDTDDCASFVDSTEGLFWKVSVGGTVIKNTTDNTVIGPVSTASNCGAAAGVVALILTASR